MTCIVGMIDGEGIAWLGADSLGSNGYTGEVYKNRKVFKHKDSGDILIGYTTSFRMGQLLQYSKGLFDELSLLKNEINEEYMVNKFIPKVQTLFKDGGYEKDGKGGNFIITVKDKIYEVQCDYSILEPAKGYTSVGCGENFANASMFTTKDTKMTTIERITKALESAEIQAVGVKRPFYIINSKNDEVIEIK